MNLLHRYKPLLPVVALGLLLGACDPKIDSPNPSKGNADFTKYVAVGNSLTAGFADAGLYREGQLNSYPNLVAQQMKAVGGGDFNQPLFAEAQADGSGHYYLQALNNGLPVLGWDNTDSAVIGTGLDRKTPLLAPYTGGPINNLGVPGIRLADINTPGYGLNNPIGFNQYYERLLPDNAKTKPYIQFVAESKPTFFSLWLGSNDVLAYATSGGASSSPNNGITSVNTFGAYYKQVLDTLTKNGAKGVCINIPTVTDIPFFTTVGPVLRSSLTAIKAPGMVCQTGNQGQIIQVPTEQIGTGVLIPLTATAYTGLLGRPSGKYWRDLSASTGIPLGGILGVYQLDTTQAFGFSVKNPWPSALILDATEIANVTSATTAFNNIIATEAQNRGLGLVNVGQLLSQLKTGLLIDGATLNAAYVTGGAFSLDGVHLTPRGYAVVANQIITTINTTYNASIPTLNVVDYRGVRFP